MKILTLKEKGKKALGIDEAECDRHGGPEHRYWCSRIASHLRASGYEVTEEAPIGGGKTVDLLAVRDGKRIALEVETGKSDAAANVRKCMDAGVDTVLMVPTSSRAINSVLKSIANISEKTEPCRADGNGAGKTPLPQSHADLNRDRT